MSISQQQILSGTLFNLRSCFEPYSEKYKAQESFSFIKGEPLEPSTQAETFVSLQELFFCIK